ncbi:hypothetical protein D3C71_1679990 [compost metagenome]
MGREIAVAAITDATKAASRMHQPLHHPLAVETGEASLAGEKLLHGGLFEVALLRDKPLQRIQQCIHITQRRRDKELFGEGRNQKLDLSKIRKCNFTKRCSLRFYLCLPHSRRITQRPEKVVA